MQKKNQGNQGGRGLGKGGGRGICRRQNTTEGTGQGMGPGNRLGRNANAGSGGRCGMRGQNMTAADPVQHNTRMKGQEDEGAKDASE